MSLKINHLHVKTPEPRATAIWYERCLGAVLVEEKRSARGQVSFRLDLGGVPLMVSDLVEGQVADQRYGLEHVALDVDDFAAGVERLTASGVAILEERRLSDGRRTCLFDGPDGVRLELQERRP